MPRLSFGLFMLTASAVVSAQVRSMSSHLPSSYSSSYASDSNSDGNALSLHDERAANPPHNLDTPRAFPISSTAPSGRPAATACVNKS